jgi:glutamine amidotransferase
MCQLLGLNCNSPTHVGFSFSGFAQRGGRTDEHKDGWGIAFFEGGVCVIVWKCNSNLGRRVGSETIKF